MTILPSFSENERETAKKLLATTVALMMGRKFEEADWSNVYCQAKNIPNQNWSNVHIDIMHNGLGVEQKMLCLPKGRFPREFAGKTLMHPSATRSIRINSTDVDADSAMHEVFQQYSKLIEQRTKRVADDNPERSADMRVGWLLWERSLTEFLYFEEPMIAPDPNDYRAVWEVKSASNVRKASKNLWIYEKASGKKRFSVTTMAGIKIQPYFDVPPISETNLVYFKVQGEETGENSIRIWLSASTVRELRTTLGIGANQPLNPTLISDIIIKTEKSEIVDSIDVEGETNLAIPLEIEREAYSALLSSWKGISDEHRIQLLVQTLRGK